MTPTTREPVRVADWYVTGACPECPTRVVWVADAVPEADLLALHRQLCHGDRAARH